MGSGGEAAWICQSPAVEAVFVCGITGSNVFFGGLPGRMSALVFSTFAALVVGRQGVGNIRMHIYDRS